MPILENEIEVLKLIFQLFKQFLKIDFSCLIGFETISYYYKKFFNKEGKFL